MENEEKENLLSNDDCISLLPIILFRLKLILMAEELRNNIFTSSKSLQMKPMKAKSVYNFGACNQALQQKINRREENPEPSNDLIKLPNKIISYLGTKDEEISQCLLLKAVTLKRSEEENNLERLEFLGDSFLQYYISLKISAMYPNESKKKLNEYRTNIVKNSFLFEKAQEKNIGSYVHAVPFDLATWCPPNYIERKLQIVQLKDKCISDVIEAIIGAFLIANGHKTAIVIIHWLNLIDNNESEFLLPARINPISDEKLEEFQNKIEYRFKNNIILKNSLKPMGHQDSPSPTYHSLRFVGDAILQYVITRKIFEQYRNSGPGAMTDFREKIHNSHVYACLAVKFNLTEYLILEDSEVVNVSSTIQSFKESTVFKDFLVSFYTKTNRFIHCKENVYIEIYLCFFCVSKHLS